MATQTPRTILAQGQLDGSCFLYSLANAALCLGFERSNLETGWSTAVTGLKNSRDFLDLKKGTARNADNAKADVRLAREFLGALAPGRFSVTLLDRADDLLSSVREHLNPESVLVIDNGQHWYCIVDVEKRTFHAACSAALTHDHSDQEWWTSTELNLKRRANAKVTGISRLAQTYLRLLKIEHSPLEQC